MQLDADEKDSGSAPEAPAKGAVKARLLTLDDLDRRTRAYQRTQELRDGIISDLGGAEHLTILHRTLAESVAVLSAMIRDMETRFLSGQPVDLIEYTTLINARRREAQTVGLERRARDVTPDLRDYVRQHGAKTEGSA